LNRVTQLVIVHVAAWVTSAAFAAVGADKPVRIMSISLCTDAQLIELVEPDRITSVTYLSRQRGYSSHLPQAAHLRINHGLAEEVLADKPDLVLAGTYTTPATRALLKRFKVPLLEVPPANDFEQIRETMLTVSEALGESERARRLLEKMDATLRELETTRPHRTIRVVGWNGGGSVPGDGTLFGAILRAAGGTNIAAEPGLQSSHFGIERLLVSHPDVLAYGSANLETQSLRTDADQHPLILKLYSHRRIQYPELLFSCGLPESAEAARAMRTLLLKAMDAK
jgi:iron complex transport system substrate-binding protein